MLPAAPPTSPRARSKPDGYTLMVGNVTTNAITPVLFAKKFSINFEKDVVSVSRLAIYPSFLLTTTQNFEPKSVAELIAYAKKNPGKVRYTSAGVGSFPHYDVEVFSKRAGIEMLHIPNKTGAAGMINDLVVGDAQVAFINAASTASMIKAGKLRPIAVLAETRLAEYPDAGRGRLPRRGHFALAEHAGTSQYAERGSGNPLQGDRRGRGCPAAAGSLQEATRQRQAERVVAGGAIMARQRTCRVAKDRRRGQDRIGRLACGDVGATANCS
jgi:Tripartite tricarboxylate transporter family receptor